MNEKALCDSPNCKKKSKQATLYLDVKTLDRALVMMPHMQIPVFSLPSQSGLSAEEHVDDRSPAPAPVGAPRTHDSSREGQQRTHDSSREGQQRSAEGEGNSLPLSPSTPVESNQTPHTKTMTPGTEAASASEVDRDRGKKYRPPPMLQREIERERMSQEKERETVAEIRINASRGGAGDLSSVPPQPVRPSAFLSVGGDGKHPPHAVQKEKESSYLEALGESDGHKKQSKSIDDSSCGQILRVPFPLSLSSSKEATSGQSRVTTTDRAEGEEGEGDEEEERFDRENLTATRTTTRTVTDDVEFPPKQHTGHRVAPPSTSAVPSPLEQPSLPDGPFEPAAAGAPFQPQELHEDDVVEDLPSPVVSALDSRKYAEYFFTDDPCDRRFRAKFPIAISDPAFGCPSRIIGGGGANMKDIVSLTNQTTKMRLRGVGSGFREDQLGHRECPEPLHLCLSSPTAETFAIAFSHLAVLIRRVHWEFEEFHLDVRRTAYRGLSVFSWEQRGVDLKVCSLSVGQLWGGMESLLTCMEREEKGRRVTGVPSSLRSELQRVSG
uniref:KHDC4/BBP-like KH-domain type I domain-containing protein n=1 Tax=Chromera velia CCMP2878 TaxID=1169474 RepID=A0A0G4EZ48_9ALVE|eukprot:Cvel_14284.t1-p1 / transcript=Cvel_14284.t1 / gene=Cvel_14284 / organism=Chromera_velia_CCMP2878 / gene_product=hypothetical protein / transcript_product=hypothetical protein / location=Cvel_scaffold1008:56078-60077(+) / protein_length=551 / sequence_SO=supercontig / SO=protein_coding / is_pseudo=false